MLIGDRIQQCTDAGVVILKTEISCRKNGRLLATRLEEARKNS